MNSTEAIALSAAREQEAKEEEEKEEKEDDEEEEEEEQEEGSSIFAVPSGFSYIEKPGDLIRQSAGLFVLMLFTDVVLPLLGRRQLRPR